jgi:uncharacterized protein (TIGR03086 family)
VTNFDDLARSQREVRTRVAAVSSGQWTAPTPCERWSVRDLVVHLVEGCRMTVRLLEGASVEEARSVFRQPHGDDLLAELDPVLAAEAEAFSRADSLTMTVHHPAAGDIPGQLLLEFRTTDYALHSWDLARATGSDEELPEVLVASVWEALQPMVPIIDKTGVYGSGPSGTVDGDAPLQRRLLDLSGRRP